MKMYSKTKSILALFLYVALAFSIPASPAFAAKKAKIDGVININTATPEQLKLLPRIGTKIAARVIAYRKKNKFAHPSDLMKVRGIGTKTFAKFKKNITTGKPTKFKLVQ